MRRNIVNSSNNIPNNPTKLSSSQIINQTQPKAYPYMNNNLNPSSGYSRIAKNSNVSNSNTSKSKPNSSHRETSANIDRNNSTKKTTLFQGNILSSGIFKNSQKSKKNETELHKHDDKNPYQIGKNPQHSNLSSSYQSKIETSTIKTDSQPRISIKPEKRTQENNPVVNEYYSQPNQYYRSTSNVAQTQSHANPQINKVFFGNGQNYFQ